MKTQIRRKKWNWIGHMLRKPHNSITKQALIWNPQGKRSHSRLKTIGEDQLNKNCGKWACDGPKLNDKLRTESSGRKLWITYTPLRSQGTI